MLRFIPDNLKTKNMCKHAVTKLPLVITYLADQYKTRMCDKAVLENGGMLKTVPDCYKNKKIRNKAVDNYARALEFVPDCYKTQKMCNKAVNTSPSAIQFVPECSRNVY